jgi:hypothetical protein
MAFTIQQTVIVPLFNPTSLITGAGGFWRADMGVSTSGANATQWNDQSLFANNLTNNGTASNVTFSSTGFNTSFPGVSIVDSSDGTMQVAASFSSGATVSWGMLISPGSSNASSNGRWEWLYTSGTTNDFTSPAFTTYEVNTPYFFQPYSSGPLTSGTTLVASTPVLIGGVFDGANFTLWKNGSSISSVSFSANLGAASGVIFGIGSSPSQPAAGSSCAFWWITQKAMNGTDWANLKNWSNANWGTSF